MIHNASAEKTFRLYMIDVNDFKQVNDKFGHLVGDKALQLVADALHNVSDRLHGFCARYGGDEFVLIIQKDIQIQETIQNEVDTLRESCADLIPRITVCTGYTECSTDAVTAAQLIALADEQLYIQKKLFHGEKIPSKKYVIIWMAIISMDSLYRISFPHLSTKYSTVPLKLLKLSTERR